MFEKIDTKRLVEYIYHSMKDENFKKCFDLFNEDLNTLFVV